ncbi:MAG: hypothetical protein KGI19_08945 [Thaumarchaeota archaeon]|nr:hypothetical protein [Nitrososphaerota archaeon]
MGFRLFGVGGWLNVDDTQNYLAYGGVYGATVKTLIEHFKKQDILERQKLYQKICEEIWDLKGFNEIVNS